MRRNGFDVATMKMMKVAEMEPCTPSTVARRSSGRFAPNSQTAAPNSARISTQSSIEPSWFPQTPEIL